MTVHGGRSVDDVRVGGLERGGHRRGGVQPSSEADPTRGGAEASSEADTARGGLHPSSEADPARGGAYPSSGADLTRGCSAVPPWWATGVTRAVIVWCAGFRCVSWSVICVFCEF
jgi:hypothetical protein